MKKRIYKTELAGRGHRLGQKRHLTRKIFSILLIPLLLVMIVILLKTALFKTAVKPSIKDPIKIEGLFEEELNKLSQALRFRTISMQNENAVQKIEFENFNRFLENSFPLVHQHLQRDSVNTFGRIYLWQGKNQSLDPILLIAHYDVVPVDSLTLSEWEAPPFAGKWKDKQLFGRGSIDDKHEVMAKLEAVEALLKEGFHPQRSLYLAFGFDEEIGGEHGAKAMSAYFHQKNIRFDAVYDEGGFVTTPGTSGIDASIALIGIAEKGGVNVKITVTRQGGHSSMPQQQTAITDLAQIIQNMQNNPFEGRLIPPVKMFLTNVCGVMGFTTQMAVANQWLFSPLLLKILSGKPQTNAMIRTTSAMTLCQSGTAINIMPETAEMSINFRLLPGDTPDHVLAYCNKMTEGLDAQIEILSSREPSSISRTDTKGYQQLTDLIGQYYPNAIITPFLCMANTDAKHYDGLSESIYRFIPMWVSSAESSRMHNSNEHLSAENYKRMLMFYRDLIREYDR